MQAKRSSFDERFFGLWDCRVGLRPTTDTAGVVIGWASQPTNNAKGVAFNLFRLPEKKTVSLRAIAKQWRGNPV